MSLNTSKGFTLIELMIVVSIIGILASIAVPAYQDYIAKAQIGEAVQLLDGAHSIIEEDVFQTATFPADTADLINLGVRTQGTYGYITTSANAEASTGTLKYTYTSGNSQLTIANKNTVSFTRDINGTWLCSSNLPAKLVPKTCSTN